MYNQIFIILLLFLTFNLVVGLYYGRKVKTIKAYALGDRNFSTATLVSTIVATWIGGDYLFITIEEVYKTGLHYAIACLGMVVQFLIIAYFFVPRMGEFLGSISIAEAMGNLYGEKVRIISALCGAIGSIGILAIQFKSFGLIFKYFIEVDIQWAIIVSAMFVILYSAFGGIRAVTCTDIVQFFVFGVLIPILGVVIYLDVHNLQSFNTNKISGIGIFDFQEFVGLNNINFWKIVSLFLLFSFPGFEPAMFQRISIGKNVLQVKRSFYIAAGLLFFILVGMSLIGFLVYQTNPNIDPSNVIYYIMDHYGDGGLKIFILIGVVAMCMSTADSQLNATSVLIAHDFLRPLKILVKNELLLSKITAVILGGIAIYLATQDVGMLELVLLTQNFYIPIVGVAFLFAIFGFRSTSKSVLIGMGAGFTTVTLWEIFISPKTGINSFWCSFLINSLFFIVSHYFFKQPGGWVGVKQQHVINSQKLVKRYQVKQILLKIKNFDFWSLLSKNMPKRELSYLAFGGFGLISSICSMHAMAKGIGGGSKEILILYEVMLIIPVWFLMYQIWPDFIKKGKILQLFWNFSVFFILCFCSSFFLLLTNFCPFQFVIFIVNIIAIGMLIRWQAAIGMMIIGTGIALIFYKSYTGNEMIETDSDAVLLITYSVILISTLILSLIMPIQDYQAQTEEVVAHLDDRLSIQQKELASLNEVKNEFLRNIKHETNTPVTGILSLGQALYHNYDKLSEEDIKSGLKSISESSAKFDRVIKNICDLSKLTTLSYCLNYQKYDISELIFNRLNVCKRIYLKNQELEIVTDIEPNVSVDCDQYYITSVLDNLIINAITHNKQGKIMIKLYTLSQEIKFDIIDEGSGIPTEELLEIFSAFVVGKQKKTLSGGRGVGLAICKKVIEAHGGKIWAENNYKKGAIFSFVLPIENISLQNSEGKNNKILEIIQ